MLEELIKENIFFYLNGVKKLKDGKMYELIFAYVNNLTPWSLLDNKIRGEIKQDNGIDLLKVENNSISKTYQCKFYHDKSKITHMDVSKFYGLSGAFFKLNICDMFLVCPSLSNISKKVNTFL